MKGNAAIMSREQAIHALTNLDAMIKRKEYLDKAIRENQERQNVTPSFMPLSKEDRLPTNQADIYLREQLEILCKKKLFVTAKGRYKLEDSIRSTPEFQDKVEQDHRNIAENRRREKEAREDHEKRLSDRTDNLKEKFQLYTQERDSLIRQIENTNILHPKDFPKSNGFCKNLRVTGQTQFKKHCYYVIQRI